ncbi:MAG: DNA replication/repair protein RecF [Colwellia sp.]|jgi:DNA replication and repair protein RecF|uniref:DNA replication/repair protein RecF n=1 Tax=Colwellia sp. Bg11-12 TaxID=2759817 RepID=UPI0015F57D7A|nr:DNA replication/repair protein RecF [Colwellia sp. Bg11-12]MBA6263304.1 DNA replication/repair protein RecF [Colwellia sp. Bg11-12]
MSIEKLTVFDFRNLASDPIELNDNINFIIGDNGSGKSSLLEAIFYLGHGKSFRTSQVENLVTHSKKKFIVSAKDNKGLQLGVAKDFDTGLTEIKIAGEKYRQLSQLAINVAVQVITPESFKLFFGGPKQRRRFIDLGLFHVKQSFSDCWKEFSRILKHRNACLRSKADNDTLNYWTHVFCEASVRVAKLRDEYIKELSEELQPWLELMLPTLADGISISYTQGWNSKKSLNDVLSQNSERERKCGFSLYGAQKFDVKFLTGSVVIDNQLSRGQQKLFLLALTFAQAKLIEKVKRVKPILLIDDVGAELDFNSRTLLNNAINKLDCQVIITAIDKIAVEPLVPTDNNYKMFHVKHGQISAIGK